MNTVKKGTRRMSWGVRLVVLLVLAGAATGAYLGYTQFDLLCTELAIKHFRMEPSETGARTLADLVDDQAATARQVQRILPLLLTPKVTTEDAYPLGTMPKVQVELPFKVALRNLVADVNESVWVEGKSQYSAGMSGARTLPKNPHTLYFYPMPKEPGTYRMEIRYSYRLIPRRRRVWQWDPRAGIFLPRRAFVELPAAVPAKPRYECEFAVPVEITVVQKVRLQSSTG